MPEFHHHDPRVPDRRSTFAFLMYLFLAAMFGIVFSNNLMWIYFFWRWRRRWRCGRFIVWHFFGWSWVVSCNYCWYRGSAA
jgi:hypothetical protein